MRNARGFVLVELILVIGLVGLMSGIIFMSFSRQRDESAVQVAARDVAATIRMAQSSALSGVKRGIPQSDSDRALCSIEVGSNGSASYRVRVHYDNGLDGICPTPPTEEAVSDQGTFALANSVSFGGDWKIFFRIPRAEVIFGGGTSIVLSRNGSSSSVCVLASGVVLENPSSCP